MADTVHAVTIIGSGPAGYTAAIYAARANLAARHLRRRPGAGRPCAGPGRPADDHHRRRELPRLPRGDHRPRADGALPEAGRALRHRRSTWRTWSKVDLSARPFTLKGESGRTLQAETVIIATGASAKWLNVPGRGRVQEPRRVRLRHLRRRLLQEPGRAGGGRRRHRDGGGDLPRQDRQQGHRDPPARPASAPRRSCRSACSSNPKISFVWNTVVEEVLGRRQGLTGARVRNVQDRRGHDADAPAASSWPSATSRTPQLFEERLETARERLPQDRARQHPHQRRRRVRLRRRAGRYYRQAVTAAGTGCMAAIDAERFLMEHGE